MGAIRPANFKVKLFCGGADKYAVKLDDDTLFVWQI